MDTEERHAHEPDASFDGGDLDCGGGLLLLIRRHIDRDFPYWESSGSKGNPIEIMA